MNKYKIDKVINGRFAVWYMNILNSKSKLGVWRIIDLYSGTRETRFAFRKKVKGTEKTQEQLDEILLESAIKKFYKKNAYISPKALLQLQQKQQAKKAISA